MSNILVYSGPGVSTSALSHTLRTLQSLCPTYDVRPTSAQELALDPWQETASLVVLPGGRDLPYVEEWSQVRSRSEDNGGSSSSTAQDSVRHWVTQAGGSFLGICAGAYFASSYCAFERGTSMQVVGARKGLEFFPGECRGTVYKGFVYESDEGARVVRLDTPSSGNLAMHYNGGGAFIDANQAHDSVQILATYPLDDPDVASSSGDDVGVTYAGQAAVVLCKAGKGRALLFGTHPEFSLLASSRPVRLSGAPQTLSNTAGESSGGDKGEDDVDMTDVCHTAAQVAERYLRELQQEDIERRRYFGECLARLGLRVQMPPEVEQHKSMQTSVSIPPNSTEMAASGRLSPLYLVAESDVLLQQTIEVVQGSEIAAASSSHPLRSAEGFLFSTQDSNDLFLWSAAGSAASQQSHTACQEDVYPVDDNETEAPNLHKVPKYLIASSLLASTPQREWDFSLYFTCLQQARAPLDCLPREKLGSIIQYGERVTSTQTMLDKNPRLMRVLPSGFTSLATHQISGRGRGGNAWISPLGCLQFSTLLHIPSTTTSISPSLTPQHNLGSTPMAIGPKLVFVQYLAGLAVVQAIRTGLGAEYAEIGRKVRLKWPNDIYAEVEEGPGMEERKGVFRHLGKKWAKMGGVLVNSQFANGTWSLVVGCGINTLNPLPTTSLSALIDWHNLRHTSLPPLPHISQECLAATVLTSFSSLWSHFLTQGGWSSTLARLYRDAWLHSDQQVTLTTLVPPLEVRIVGIASDTGLLRAIDLSSSSAEIRSEDQEVAWGPSAQRRAGGGAATDRWHSGTARGGSMTEGVIELQPDGNSFDMLRNLIKVKD